MRTLAIQLIFTLIFFANCYIDTGSPSRESLHEVDQKVLIKVNDVEKLTPVYLRFSTASLSKLSGPSQAKYIDIDGKFFQNYEVAFEDTSFSLLMFLDINQNGRLDTGDKGVSKFNVALPEKKQISFEEEYEIDLSKTALELRLSSTEFVSLTEVSPNVTGTLEINTKYICIFTPSQMIGWSSTDRANYITADTPLPLSDWSLVANFETDGNADILAATQQNAFLISGITYNGTCVIDTNRDGTYDYHSNTNTEIVVPAFTPAGGTFDIP